MTSAPNPIMASTVAHNISHEGWDMLPQIEHLTCDSRQVGEMSVFVAIEGHTVNGHDHIPEAIARGARAIIHHHRFDDNIAQWSQLANRPVDFIGVADTRLASAQLAAKVWPDAPETLAAITGTNGKTSVAWMTAQLWGQLGYSAASVGTLGVNCWGPKANVCSGLDGDERKPEVEPASCGRSHLTTQDALIFHQSLQSLAKAGVSHLACEASSHGLDQKRLDGAKISVAVFTNLSRDHLDYHADMESYKAAKARLFSEVLQTDGTAVIQIDSPEGREMAKIARAHGYFVLTVGRSDAADLRLLTALPEAQGIALTYALDGQTLTATLPACGVFQADNLGLALGSLMASKTLPRDEAGRLVVSKIADAIADLKPVPGRMQPIGRTSRGGMALVDFAHTPDALMRCCDAARSHVSDGCRLGLVFGAGGDRDSGKRAEMGQIAATHADFAIITNDNPRTEDPAAIANEIAVGHPQAKIIHDRRAAIAAGLEALEAGDILIVAGKGDERAQIIGTEAHPFHDPTVIKSLLADQKAGEASA